MTSLPSMISSPPLAMADLKPSVQLVFKRLLRDYSDQYRIANEEKEKSKAQSIVKTFYDIIASECAPTEELVKELPPRNRLEDLIRSSLDFGLTRASTKTKTVQKPYGKQKPSSQASLDSVEGTATNDSDRTGIPAGVTISLSAKRAYRQAVEEANKKNLDQQQAILRLNQQQEYLRQLNNCLASQNRIPANDLLDRQETLCLQHRCMEHYEQKRQCMQVIAVLEQWQSEARNILNRQSLDPVTRSKIANGLLERQYVIDSQSVHLDTLIEQEKKLSARTNPTLNRLSAKKETNTSDSTTIAAKEVKDSSKGDAMGKPSAKAEKKPSTLKKTRQNKKKKKKSTPFLNRIEGVVRPDMPTSSALVDVGNDGDSNHSSVTMKMSHTATLEKKTRKTSIDRKRRKKKRKKQSKRKKAVENPQPLVVPEKKPPEIQSGISAPASEDEPQGSRSDGPIPEYLPASVQKALKHLAPHNIPGNTTVGDNAFIIDTALYDSSSRVQTRKRRRDNI